MNPFFAALQFLTLCPWPKRVERCADEIGRSVTFFPIVGFFLGSVLVLANFLLERFANAILVSVGLVALLALLTRGLHLDGLGDTFDGLGAEAQCKERFGNAWCEGNDSMRLPLRRLSEQNEPAPD